jgi:transposase-like protein
LYLGKATPSIKATEFEFTTKPKKAVYFIIEKSSKKWTMQIRNRKTALNRFMIKYEDRLKGFI